MLGFVTIVLVLAAIAGTVVVVAMIFDMTFGRGGALAEAEARRQGADAPRPGLRLLEAARAAALRVVRRALSNESRASVASGLSFELRAVAVDSMLPNVPAIDSTRIIACPAAGQGVVAVTAPEAIELADTIRSTVSHREIERIRHRARAYVAWTREGRWEGELPPPCALQGDDCVCIAYSSRPLSCLPLHATVIGGDLEARHDPPDRDLPWPYHTEAIGSGFRDGVTAGLEEAGLDGTPYELHGALLRALDDEDAEARWAAHEPVFAGCLSLRPSNPSESVADDPPTAW